MYDIPELEKKWRIYKRRQRRKPIIITLLSLIIIGGGAVAVKTYLNSTKNQQEIVATKPKATPSVTTQQQPAIVIKKLSNQTPPSNVSSNKLLNIQPTPQTQNTPEAQIDLSKATIIKPNVPDAEIRVIGFDDKKEKKAVEDTYSDILIPKKSTQNIQIKEEIAELEEKFKETQNPQDSLKLARLYYKLGDYKKAEDWAVNTNNLDGDIEESWLIFAKSRAKQGFRTDAITVLQTFYDETNSQKAKVLLDKLRRGKKF